MLMFSNSEYLIVGGRHVDPLGFSVIVLNERAMHISVIFLCFQQGDAHKGDQGEKGKVVCDYYCAFQMVYHYSGPFRLTFRS